MKESYGKGIANHPAPESCVVSRKAAIEALTAFDRALGAVYLNGLWEAMEKFAPH